MDEELIRQAEDCASGASCHYMKCMVNDYKSAILSESLEEFKTMTERILRRCIAKRKMKAMQNHCPLEGVKLDRHELMACQKEVMALCKTN